ncbi:MAG: efflux RND transporter periplasmic adaptor subunit [Candidatus Sulfobium sp.]|jgi:RND family efflux transporter MFP subunit
MAQEDLSKLKIDKSKAVIKPAKRRKWTKWTAIIAVAALAFVLYLFGVFSPATGVKVISVTKMYPSRSFTLLNASGYVVAQRKAAVASKITGRLVSISVEEGSRVKKGEILARLENEDVLAARAQAEATLNAARYNLDQARAELHDAALNFSRSKELVEKGYIARTDYDSAEARYRKAVAAVAGAKAEVKASEAALRAEEVALGYTFIRAPFDAVVLTKDADVGDIVTPIGAAANVQAAVVTIADMSSLQVEADVSESNIELVKPGQPCEIELDSLPDSRFRGAVHMIVPTADRTKATVMVKVRFIDKDPGILPEMSARVAFLEHPVGPHEEKPLIAVSSNAIVDRKGKTSVFVVKEDRAVRTSIKTGRHFDDMVEVLEGLDTGEKVIIDPAPGLRDGDRIKILEG